MNVRVDIFPLLRLWPTVAVRFRAGVVNVVVAGATNSDDWCGLRNVWVVRLYLCLLRSGGLTGTLIFIILIFRVIRRLVRLLNCAKFLMRLLVGKINVI